VPNGPVYVGGLTVCTDLCIFTCAPYTTNCTLATSSFTNLLTADSCTVMVRVNWDATQINGYSVNCAPHAATTETDALNQILIMSSINWSGATSIADATTGLYAFTTSDTSYKYAAYFNRNSGKMLLITQAPQSSGTQGGFRIASTWSPGSDLGTSCAPGASATAVSFGVTDSSFNYGPALNLLLNTDLFRSLRVRGLEVTPVAVTRTDVSGPEYLFFLSTVCPTC
jgi:hypothetical protein